MQVDSRYDVGARYPTPLRYPGGKQRLGPFFARLLQRNDLISPHYFEAFAGGAGVAMYLLKKGLVKSVSLNDLDRSVYAFWYAATQRNSALCRMIERAKVTVPEWDRQKEVQRNKESASLLELGFSTLFLNRTNRSGILRAGMIGGRDQAGLWKIDARFDRVNIAARVSSLREFSSRISVHCLDAMEFVDFASRRRWRRKLIYLDPPYFEKGDDLYLNRYTLADHSALAASVRALTFDWVLTYDDVPAVGALYKGLSRRKFELGYSADSRRDGRELMLRSPRLKLPTVY